MRNKDQGSDATHWNDFSLRPVQVRLPAWLGISCAGRPVALVFLASAGPGVGAAACATATLRHRGGPGQGTEESGAAGRRGGERQAGPASGGGATAGVGATAGAGTPADRGRIRVAGRGDEGLLVRRAASGRPAVLGGAPWAWHV